MTSDLSIGTIDSESLGVLVARGDDCPPEMQRASWRSLLPFLRLREREREREKERERATPTRTHSVVVEDSLLLVDTQPPGLPALQGIGPLAQLPLQLATCRHTHTQRTDTNILSLSLSLVCTDNRLTCSLLCLPFHQTPVSNRGRREGLRREAKREGDANLPKSHRLPFTLALCMTSNSASRSASDRLAPPSSARSPECMSSNTNSNTTGGF